jgi:hypothetical protein
MLVASEKRYIPTEVNMIVLKKDEVYFYVHRDLYDKATILNDRYKDKLAVLWELMPATNANDEAVTFWYNNAPVPLNILAPYLKIFDVALEATVISLAGALHIIGKSFDVLRYLMMPKELRNSVVMSVTLDETYEMEWEALFRGMLDYEARNVPTMPQYAPMPYAMPYPAPGAYAPPALVPAEEEDEEDEDEEDPFANLFAFSVEESDEATEEPPPITGAPVDGATEAGQTAGLFARFGTKKSN